MNLRTTINCILGLLLSFSAYCQTIECIGELVIGEDGSYVGNSTLFNDEIYFVDSNFDLSKYNDSDNSFRTVDNLEPSFISVRHVVSNEEALFYIGSFFSEQNVYFSDGSSGAGTLVVEFDGDIEQRNIVENGLVVIEQDLTNTLRNGYFIDNQGSAPVQIMDSVDIIQDFAITESRNVVIISRQDEADFDGGVFFFDTDTNTRLTDEMVIPDACNNITDARGFRDFIYYRCGSQDFLYSHETQTSSNISVNNGDLEFVGETEDFLFMAFTFGRLYATNKETNSSRLIADDLPTFPEFVVHRESVYYINDRKITAHNGTDETVYDSNFGSNDNLLKAETLNDKVHVVAEDGFFNLELLVLDEDSKTAEIITEIDLFSSSAVAFHFINESIIFANGDELKGQEFFRLTYEPNATETLSNIKNVKLFPNPVSEELIVDISDDSGTFSSYRITNFYGQLMQSDKFEHSIDVSKLDSGIYFISMYSKDQPMTTFKFSKI